MGEEEVLTQKKQLAIKLAKNMEPFDFSIGEEFDAIYVETLTEDIKQAAREIKKLAKVVALLDTKETGHLTVIVKGEEERVTKMMRRYSTEIQEMADLLYGVAYMDFAGLAQAELDKRMGVDDGSSEEDDDE